MSRPHRLHPRLLPRSLLLVLAPLALAVALLVGCGDAGPDSDGSGWTGTVDTLDGGRVVVRSPDRPAWSDGDAWRAEEVSRLGSLDASGPELFGEIRGVVLDPEGRLHVLDSQAKEIRTFDTAGIHLRTFGRPGQGPGELEMPAGLALDPEGRLWVPDFRNGRYAVYDASTGEAVAEHPRRMTFMQLPWPGGVDVQGRLLDVGLLPPSGPEAGERALFQLDSLLQPGPSILLPRLDEAYRATFVVGGVPRMSMTVPFAPAPAWTPDFRGGMWAGEGAAYRIHRIDFDGDTTRTLELDRGPSPLTSAERDTARAALERTFEAQGMQPEREPTIPTERPAHGSLAVDDEGHLWVQRPGAPDAPVAFDVFDPEGRYLGVVDLGISAVGAVPPAFAGDRMAVVAQPDGVPTVVVYRLAGRSLRP